MTEAVYATIPRGAFESLQTDTTIPAQVIAPLVADKAVGIVSAQVGGETVATADLYSVKSIDEGSLLQIAWDEALLWFE